MNRAPEKFHGQDNLLARLWRPRATTPVWYAKILDGRTVGQSACYPLSIGGGAPGIGWYVDEVDLCGNTPAPSHSRNADHSYKVCTVANFRQNLTVASGFWPAPPGLVLPIVSVNADGWPVGILRPVPMMVQFKGIYGGGFKCETWCGDTSCGSNYQIDVLPTLAILTAGSYWATKWPAYVENEIIRVAPVPLAGEYAGQAEWYEMGRVRFMIDGRYTDSITELRIGGTPPMIGIPP